jgi:hypothetical protein
MEFKQIQEIADSLIPQARGRLVADKSFEPTLFCIEDGNRIEAIPFTLNNEEDAQRVQDLIQARTLTSIGVIQIIDGYINISAKGEELPPDDVPLSECPTASEAIICVIHSKVGTATRIITYHADENGGYSFFDRGWEGLTSSSGALGNPY